MIRLWNRVGWYRTLAVLLLLGAVAGGVAVAADRPTQQTTAASQSTADREREAQDQADREAERAEAERAARSDAQRKADEAAVTAAEQAKPTTTPSTRPSKPAGPPARPNLPIPASCAVYSGNRAIGCTELLAIGFGLGEMPCLDKLWTKESKWNHNAYNRSSDATGIPQAVPGRKMATEGADWKTNPTTQIRWGLKYIKGHRNYGAPCKAWAHSQAKGWY